MSSYIVRKNQKSRIFELTLKKATRRERSSAGSLPHKMCIVFDRSVGLVREEYLPHWVTPLPGTDENNSQFMIALAFPEFMSFWDKAGNLYTITTRYTKKAKLIAQMRMLIRAPHRGG